MRLKTALMAIALGLAATACTMIRGSGDVVTIEAPVGEFSRLEVSHTFEVNVSVGEEPSLTLRVDDNLEADLNVVVDGDTLHIGLQPNTTTSNATLEADVTVTSLEAIEGSGAVDIHLDLLNADNLDLELSGASDLDGTVEFGSMTARISGASNLSLLGRVGSLDIEASGASDLAILDLAVDDLFVRLSGASDVEVTVNDSIEAVLSGASSLRYRGDPEVTTFESSGASTIGKITEPG